MLDLDHPQTPYIFYASGIEDRIREVLVACKQGEQQLNQHTRAMLVSEHIVALKTLNEDHFNGNEGIRRSLADLEKMILNEPDLEKVWKEFLSFADVPGDNFGTWAI